MRRPFPFGDILFAGILICILLITLVPFIHIISTSFSTAIGMKPGLRLWPYRATLASYQKVMKTSDTLTGIRNSLLRISISVPVSVVVNALAAYATSKNDMPGGKALRVFFMAAIYLSIGIIPMYMTMRAYHLVGTFWIYTLNITMPFYMILMRNYMQGISQSMEEAALLDGASYWQFFWKILFPLSKPIIATVSLFSFFNSWNVYTDCLLYNASKPEHFTLAYVLYLQLSSASKNMAEKTTQLAITDTNTTTLRCALTCLTALPIMIIYPLAQKYLVTGITIGSVKE